MHIHKKNFLFCFFIFIHLINRSTLYLRQNERITNYENQIIMKVKDSGRQQLLSANYRTSVPWALPTNVFLDGNSVQFSDSDVSVDVDDNNSIIKMVWDKRINCTYYMFFSLSNIVELDLSSFDLSEVISAAHMFEGCTSLVSLDLSNCNTSKIQYMSYMFYNCKSLISLNLSNFNTRNLEEMVNMFQGCSSLKYLDVSNF